MSNMAAWYRKGIGITASSNAVSSWADQSGNGRNAVQATAGAKPTLQGDGTIVFDGTSDVLKTAAFTLNQPVTIYARLKLLSNTPGYGVMVDGFTNNSGALYTPTNQRSPGVYAGGNLSETAGNLTFDVYANIAGVINGANSFVQLDSVTGTSDNAGSNNMGGITLGSSGDGIHQFANIQAAEFIFYSVAHDATQRAAVFHYLSSVI